MIQVDFERSENAEPITFKMKDREALTLAIMLLNGLEGNAKPSEKMDWPNGFHAVTVSREPDPTPQ